MVSLSASSLKFFSSSRPPKIKVLNQEEALQDGKDQDVVPQSPAAFAGQKEMSGSNEQREAHHHVAAVAEEPGGKRRDGPGEQGVEEIDLVEPPDAIERDQEQDKKAAVEDGVHRTVKAAGIGERAPDTKEVDDVADGGLVGIIALGDKALEWVASQEPDHQEVGGVAHEEAPGGEERGNCKLRIEN